jgi:ERCC4-related helicase
MKRGRRKMMNKMTEKQSKYIQILIPKAIMELEENFLLRYNRWLKILRESGIEPKIDPEMNKEMGRVIKVLEYIRDIKNRWPNISKEEAIQIISILKDVRDTIRIWGVPPHWPIYDPRLE